MVKSKSFKRLKPSKRCRCGIDRIENLPDPLISHILSLLPTKCAVATSVLSTSWKLHWTSFTNLDFDDLDLNWDESGEDESGDDSTEAVTMERNKFTNFVNRVLLLLDSPSIQNFRLNCSHAFFDPSYLNSWISEAFGRTIQELNLILMLRDKIELPLSNLLYCNVAVLQLHGDNIHFNIPAAASVCFPSLQTLHLRGITLTISSSSSVSFPTLKIMHLEYVTFANEDTVHNLFSSCPILDKLVFFRHGYDNVFCLVIRIPSLTTLKLDFYGLRYTRCKLQIDTPAIQYLHLNDDLPCEYLPTENLSSLVQAKVKLYILDLRRMMWTDALAFVRKSRQSEPEEGEKCCKTLEFSHSCLLKVSCLFVLSKGPG